MVDSGDCAKATDFFFYRPPYLVHSRIRRLYLRLAQSARQHRNRQPKKPNPLRLHPLLPRQAYLLLLAQSNLHLGLSVHLPHLFSNLQRNLLLLRQESPRQLVLPLLPSRQVALQP